MKTDIYTPSQIFNTQQRLSVPLFQRPYVWNKELQWEPLWRDIRRVLERYEASPTSSHQPHFLGAVVLQQIQTAVSDIQQRIVIDGQQRLTTLQLMLDAIHSELEVVGAKQPAARLSKLIENDAAYCNSFEDKFKVWPTNKDREAFNEVLSAPTPIDYDTLKNKNSRMVQAHQFFSLAAAEWLNLNGPSEVIGRAEILDKCCRELLQMVVIDLASDENAQEIFETLNARGAVLTPADLIKNFIFQRLQESGHEVEVSYEKYWKIFETSFWEQEINYGRMKFQRSSLFINHWLISKLREEVLGREVFSTFKHFADFVSSGQMIDLLKNLFDAALVYEKVIKASQEKNSNLSQIEVFAYRLNALELDVLRPVFINLLDPVEAPISEEQMSKAIRAIETWVVRRLVVKATNKNYNKVVVEMIKVIATDRSKAGDLLLEFFLNSNAETSYMPDDDELRKSLTSMPIYQKLYRSRIRMILEAVEDSKRGWTVGNSSKAGSQVPRGIFAIEHIMPQKWESHWPLESSTEQKRNDSIHLIGNLTLLTSKLNGSVSNSAWALKKKELHKHDVLLMNKEIEEIGSETWDEEVIATRTQSLIDEIVSIWSVPSGYKAKILTKQVENKLVVSVSDLMSAGFIASGQMLYPHQLKHKGSNAIVLDDGRIEIDGNVYDSLSLAGVHVRKKHTNGWVFWLVDENTGKSMGDVRNEYRTLVGALDEEPDSDEEDD